MDSATKRDNIKRSDVPGATDQGNKKIAYYSGCSGVVEHLLDELLWLNRLLAVHVIYLRNAKFHEGAHSFREFFIADEEIDELLQRNVFGQADSEPEDIVKIKTTLYTKAVEKSQKIYH